MSSTQLLGLFILLGVAVDGVFLSLDRFGLAVCLPLFALIAFCAWFGRDDRVEVHRPLFPDGLDRRSFLLGVLAAAPALLFLLFTWNQEFPFSGDHDFHLYAHLLSRHFWAPKLPLMLGLALVTCLSIRRQRLHAWIPFLFLALYLWSFAGDIPWPYTRYPGALYVTALPVNYVAAWLDWDSPLNVARVTNAAAIPLWLFFLRPLFLRRWPDVPALLFSVFYFWQKDIVYYFTSSYLEPWCVVWVLLAAEYLLTSSGRTRLNACLFVGLAALFKEQAILLLPSFWLGARPWTLSGRDRFHTMLIGIVSGIPFALYYLTRAQSHLWRTVAVASTADILSTARLAEYGKRLLLQWHDAGVVVLLLCFARWLVVLFRPDDRRVVYVMIALGAVSQVVFFHVDSALVGWTGYPRFQLLTWMLLGMPFLVGTAGITDRGNPRLWSLVGVVAVLNVLVLTPQMRQALLEPDPLRNFTEHYDAPVYFSIRSAVRAAEAEGVMRGIQRLTLVDRIGTHTTGVWPSAYEDLNRTYRLATEVNEGQTRPLPCRCHASDEALLIPFESFANLRAADPESALEDRRRISCLAELEQSCLRTSAVRYRGSLMGALGVGVRR